MKSREIHLKLQRSALASFVLVDSDYSGVSKIFWDVFLILDSKEDVVDGVNGCGSKKLQHFSRYFTSSWGFATFWSVWWWSDTSFSSGGWFRSSWVGVSTARLLGQWQKDSWRADLSVPATLHWNFPCLWWWWSHQWRVRVPIFYLKVSRLLRRHGTVAWGCSCRHRVAFHQLSFPTKHLSWCGVHAALWPCISWTCHVVRHGWDGSASWCRRLSSFSPELRWLHCFHQTSLGGRDCFGWLSDHFFEPVPFSFWYVQ